MKYHQARDAENLKKLEEVKATLPFFCNRFFLGVAQTTTPLTRIAYARDLVLFFEFVITQIQPFVGKAITELTLKDLALVEVYHIEMYADYLSRYERNGKIFCNGPKAKQRKLSTLRAFFAYFFKKGEIPSNILPNVDLPKITEKAIVRLDAGEIEDVLDAIDDDTAFTEGEQRFRKLIGQRDFTIWMFFLSTGLRISELVGLNVGDIDLGKGSFKVTRKGGAETILYMSEELCMVMEVYMHKYNGEENDPLFRSIRNERISVRQVGRLVKKYAKFAVPLKNITPHKLRSTYGTNLYRETGDIYVVADVLGHKDVNTTKKHYAAISEDSRKEAAKKTKVRKDPTPKDEEDK